MASCYSIKGIVIKIDTICIYIYTSLNYKYYYNMYIYYRP